MMAAKAILVSVESDLPEGWVSTELGQLVSPSREKIEPQQCPTAPYLSLEHVESRTGRILGHGKASDVKSTKSVFRAGDVIYGKLRPYLNKVTIPSFDGVCSTDFLVFPRQSWLENNYLLLFLLRSEVVEFASHRSTGVQLPRVNFETLAELEFPLPPLAEQKRIVGKIGDLLARVNTARARLAHVPVILKRFRQAVLAAACSGRLTTGWRMKNPENKSVSGIVASIQERRMSEATSPREKEKIREIYALVEEGDSSDLPKGWDFVALTKLCSSFDYGTSAKSQPSGDVPVLRMGNIQAGKIDWTDLAFTSDEDEIRHYSLRPETVLFNRTNSAELVGKTGIYLGERPAIFAGYLIRINHLPEIDPRYLNICLNSDYAREFCSRVKTDAVSQSNINAQKLGTFEVPFCQLKEQQEIAHRVEALFTLAEVFEKRIDAAAALTERLTQAILARAFRGELVPTEAELARRECRSYEPASVLLDRIQRERAFVEAEKRSTAIRQTTRSANGGRRRTRKR